MQSVLSDCEPLAAHNGASRTRHLATWLQPALEKIEKESVPALWDAFRQSVDDLFTVLDRTI